MPLRGGKGAVYGDESIDSEEFTGLAPRFASLAAANADHVISAAQPLVAQ